VVDASRDPRGVEVDDVDYVRTERASLPAQRNLALEAARHDLVVFLDDDVELEPEYLAAVERWFSARQACVGVSGYIVNDDLRGWTGRLLRLALGFANDDGKLRRSGDAAYLRRPAVATRVDLLSGCNMTYRRETIEGLGLRFDERLGGYGYMEDVDFALLASDHGELWMLPEARLVHKKSLTARVPARAYVRQVFAYSALLFGKHRRRRGLSTLAFAHRMLGRLVAYLGLAIWRRSLATVRGVLEGVAAIPHMIREGAASRQT
jgi:GT2 family glycosyltransferase